MNAVKLHRLTVIYPFMNTVIIPINIFDRSKEE